MSNLAPNEAQLVARVVAHYAELVDEAGQFAILLECESPPPVGSHVGLRRQGDRFVFAGKPPSRAELRRQKMARFEARVQAHFGGMARLSPHELVGRLDTGDFYEEIAAGRRLLEIGVAATGAVLAGLASKSWKTRRTCADFFDHHGDQRCVEPLRQALRDPKEAVRRLALHALTCQDCKVCPLQGDFVPDLIDRVLNDRSARMRRVATGALGAFAIDERAFAALTHAAANDADREVRKRAGTAVARRLRR